MAMTFTTTKAEATYERKSDLNLSQNSDNARLASASYQLAGASG